LYNEGEDATKSVYIAKIEELRSAVGPIAQRYFDKEEEKRSAERAKRDEAEAMRKAQEEMAKRNNENKDAEMKDPDGQHQPQVDDCQDRMDTDRA
jgi:heat shock protein 4